MDRQVIYREHVASVSPADNSDHLDVVRVRNWQCLVRRGEFHVGQPVVYMEVDAALPVDDPRFSFLRDRGTKKMPDGTEVHVLRTIKLRGTYSQGLVLPDELFEGSLPNIQKWEPPVPGGSSPAKGTFLTQYASKTDSERVQNINDRTWAEIQEREWIATEKVDGSSLTMIKDVDGNPRVCSRNWEVSEGGVHFTTAHKTGFFDLMPNGMVVQGEIVGPGVQNNPLKLNETRLLIFDVWQDRKVIPVEDWPEWAKPHAVPTYVDLQLPATQDDAVAQADKIKSLVNPAVQAEGIVWHTADGSEVPRLARSTWKAINNSYLARQKD